MFKFHDLYAVVGQDKPFKSGRRLSSHVFQGDLSHAHVGLFLVGKCYKVPDGLDDGRKRKRKQATFLQDFRSWFRRVCESILLEPSNS